MCVTEIFFPFTFTSLLFFAPPTFHRKTIRWIMWCWKGSKGFRYWLVTTEFCKHAVEKLEGVIHQVPPLHSAGCLLLLFGSIRPEDVISCLDFFLVPDSSLITWTLYFHTEHYGSHHIHIFSNHQNIACAMKHLVTSDSVVSVLKSQRTSPRFSAEVTVWIPCLYRRTAARMSSCRDKNMLKWFAECTWEARSRKKSMWGETLFYGHIFGEPGGGKYVTPWIHEYIYRVFKFIFLFT